MGFWDSVGKIASAGIKEVSNLAKENQKYKEEMRDKSDDELLQIVKQNRATLRSGAALVELKSRGYSEEDIKFLVRNS